MSKQKRRDRKGRQAPPRVPVPPRITVQFDCDLDGIVHVSAVDRGSGKQARTTVTARAHLSPAEIASTRAELETLQWEDEEAEHDEEELEEVAATAAVPGGAGLSPEMAVLLARARRVVARGAGDTAALETAIAALEAAARRGDEAAVVEHEEALLDLLYDVDET
jgi:molecular chaperone DnaK